MTAKQHLTTRRALALLSFLVSWEGSTSFGAPANRLSISLTMSSPKVLQTEAEVDSSAQSLLELASAHFASQALNAFVKMGVPNIIGDCSMRIAEIADVLEKNQADDHSPRKIHRDGLLRIMRLLTAKGILYETDDNTFGLTNVGALLQTNVPGQQSLAPTILHWMEAPLWNAWAELPDYIAGNNAQQKDNYEEKLPFEKANGISSDDYYCTDNAASLQHANDFVRYISEGEERSVLTGVDWDTLSGKTVLDIGGHQGKIMTLIAKKHPDIKCICFDLPEVINSATAPDGVELVGGNIFDSSSLPPCDYIFMKHFLDKVMWTEEQTVQILASSRDAIPQDGKIIVAEAVLPDDAANASGTNRLHLSIDVLFLLVGRDAARTETEWKVLAKKAGLVIDTINPTKSPSCYIIVLSKAN
jgi:caffeic acid 3-O-methyltransferase